MIHDSLPLQSVLLPQPSYIGENVFLGGFGKSSDGMLIMFRYLRLVGIPLVKTVVKKPLHNISCHIDESILCARNLMNFKQASSDDSGNSFVI